VYHIPATLQQPDTISFKKVYAQNILGLARFLLLYFQVLSIHLK